MALMGLGFLLIGYDVVKMMVKDHTFFIKSQRINSTMTNKIGTSSFYFNGFVLNLHYNILIEYIILSTSKELSLCHKLWCSDPFIFPNQSHRPWIFQTMNSVRSNSLDFKYLISTAFGYKDMGIRKLELVEKKTFFIQYT